jgi:hypothetical protein
VPEEKQFLKHQARFGVNGVCLNTPVDQIPKGKVGFIRNLRSEQSGCLQVRPPIQASQALGSDPLNSLKTLNDEISGLAPLVVGNTTGTIWLSNPPTLLESGYSGNPLSFATYQPLQALKPFLYIGDSLKTRKVDSSGNLYNIGIAPPAKEPGINLALSPASAEIETLSSTSGWAATGTGGTIVSGQRVPAGTTISKLIFDNGAAPSWVSLTFTNPNDWLGNGALIIVGGETSLVQEYLPPGFNTPTTIQAIQYDTGSTGLCCIVLDSQSAALPQDGIVTIGAEDVRILSVTTGPNNSFSFRCETVGTHVAGETVTSYATARVYFANPHAAGDAVTGPYVGFTASPAGTGAITQTAAHDLAQIGGRAVTNDDYIHISVNIDKLNDVAAIRMMIDIDATTNDFTKNYLYADITQEVIAAARASLTAGSITELEALQQAAAATAPLQWTVPTDATTFDFTSYSATSQWVEILVRVGALIRVGNDPTRTLADMAAVRLELDTTATVVAQFSSWYIAGTYGPDAPVSLNPLNPLRYIYRYRSSITGATSSPSPLTRNGYFPQRQAMEITVAGSTDPQVDLIDIARVGGAVTGQPLYVATFPNGDVTFTDSVNNDGLGDPFDLGLWPLWPVQQLPITGTAGAVGTTVYATSNNLPPNLTAGTLVTVNGITTTVVGQPDGSTFQVEDSLGFIPAGSSFECGSPTTWGNPLPYIANSYDDSAPIFGVGDSLNPGRVYWSNPKDPDSARTSNFADVAAEALTGVLAYNGYVVAFSSERFYLGRNTGNPANLYQFTQANVGQGVLSPWAYAVGPLIYFLSRNGVMATDLGPAQSLSGADLYPLLPHDGQSGFAVNGYNPPDITQPEFLRLAWTRNGYLYFDYAIAGAAPLSAHQTFCWKSPQADPSSEPGWFFDEYNPRVLIHYQEEKDASTALLVGCLDGTIQFFSSTSGGDNDTNGPIHCAVRTRAEDTGDLRSVKLWGDYLVDVDAGTTTIFSELLADDWVTPLFAIGNLTGGRDAQRAPVDINSGLGAYNINLALDLRWDGFGRIFGYEFSYIPKPDRTLLRATDWTDDGNPGAKWLYGCLIEANTDNSTRTVAIYSDDGHLIATLTTVQHAQQSIKPYYFPTPYHTHMMRAVPTDPNDWQLFRIKWLWVPEPEKSRFVQHFTDDGVPEPKYLMGFVLEGDTKGQDVTVELRIDGDVVLQTFTVNHDGQLEKPYPVTYLENVNPPKVHEMRLVPTGNNIQYFDNTGVWKLRWYYTKHPEYTTWAEDYTPVSQYPQSYRGVVIDADTEGAAITVLVVDETGTTIRTLNVLHATRKQVAYSFGEFFVSTEIRLIPLGNWRHYSTRWISDDRPDLAALYSDWSDLGYQGPKFIQGFTLWADTGGQDLTLTIQFDGGVASTVFSKINHPTDLMAAYSLATPVIAYQLRTIPNIAIRYNGPWKIKWHWRPAPPLAKNWITMNTSHNLSGYLHHRWTYPCLQSYDTVNYKLTFDDGTTQTYLIPQTAGEVRKPPVPHQPHKGKLVSYALTSCTPFRLFRNDSEVRLKQWGSDGTYLVERPWGDASFEGGNGGGADI